VKISGVIFDLDGTLTQPCLDFDQIRSEIGDINGPILEAMEKMLPERRRKAEQILHRHEQIAADNAQLNNGAVEACAWLRRRKKKIGLVTRNRRASVERICQIHDLSFDSVVTREDGPVKPDPLPVLQACREMQVQPSECVMVGDYLFDLVSGRRAGAVSILLSTSENYADFAHEADYIISSLDELPGLIDKIENGQFK